MAKVLLFNIPEQKRMKLGFLLMQFRIQSRDVAAEEQGKSLQALLGRGDGPAISLKTEPFSEEMLVMDGLDDRQFHGLLDGMKALDARVALKAVTTQKNLSWSASRLYGELCAERAAFAGR